MRSTSIYLRLYVAALFFVSLSLQAVPISSLFGTGLDEMGNPLPGGSEDPHYRLTFSPDPRFPGPKVFVAVNFPGVWESNTEYSQWISPNPNQKFTDISDPTNPSANSDGVYIYSTSFDLTGFDLSSVEISGHLISDNLPLGMRINETNLFFNNLGVLPVQPFTAAFTLKGAALFHPTTNTIDFIINNGVGGGLVFGDSTGIKVTISGKGCPPSPSPPPIEEHPAGAELVLGQPYTLSVLVECGNPEYQWQRNGQPIEGAELSEYVIPEARFADAGEYTVKVSNESGTTLSLPAVVTVIDPVPKLRVHLTSGGPELSIEGAIGKRYVIEYNENLEEPGNWGYLTEVNMDESPKVFFDPSPPEPEVSPSRFYRARFD